MGRKYHRWVIACLSLPGGSNFGAHYLSTILIIVAVSRIDDEKPTVELEVETADAVDVTNDGEQSLPPETISSEINDSNEPQEIIPDVGASDWLIYRNETYGFELKYPPEWRKEKPSLESKTLLMIKHLQNILTVSVLDFRSPQAGSFQAWVNERPYSLITFNDRRALRWSRRGPSTPIFPEPQGLFGTEEIIVPSEMEDWAVDIHMRMSDVHTCDACVLVFNQIVGSLTFK